MPRVSGRPDVGLTFPSLGLFLLTDVSTGTGREYKPPYIMSSKILRGLKSGTGGRPATVGGRLRVALNHLDLKQVAFAGEVRCTQAFISMVLHDRCGPSAPLLAALDRLGISASWLMTGEGQMRRAVEESATVPQDGPLTARPLRILGRVPAGYPGPSPVVERVEGYFPMSYESVPDPDAFCLRVTGDSMAGVAEEGDLVVVSPALRTRIRNGDLVVVRLEGGDTWVKRFARSRSGAFLVSSNPAFPPMLLDPEVETTIIGKVVYTIHRHK